MYGNRNGTLFCNESLYLKSRNIKQYRPMKSILKSIWKNNLKSIGRTISNRYERTISNRYGRTISNRYERKISNRYIRLQSIIRDDAMIRACVGKKLSQYPIIKMGFRNLTVI